VTDIKGFGRPRIASDEQLLGYEWLWIETLWGLRDGAFVEVNVGKSGMFMTSNKNGRETMTVVVPGEPRRVLRQPKLVSVTNTTDGWRKRKREEEMNFKRARLAARAKAATVILPERDLWEALKRAKSAKQVRRICDCSKFWLKARLEFPDGSYVEQWPHRRMIDRYAGDFCKSKLDRRYPRRDKRESGDYRRIEYLARVLAGLTLGLSPSTAVERLRKMKHAKRCLCWRCASKIGPRYRQTLAEFLGSNAPKIESAQSAT
jgi:hypothetical protein